MNAVRPTGLGDPDPAGKRALFRPPAATANQQNEGGNSMEIIDQGKGASKAEKALEKTAKQKPPRRVRTTIDLSREALQILQDLQQHHRLETGRVLPLWKVVSEAIEYYGKMKAES